MEKECIAAVEELPGEYKTDTNKFLHETIAAVKAAGEAVVQPVQENRVSGYPSSRRNMTRENTTPWLLT